MEKKTFETFFKKSLKLTSSRLSLVEITKFKLIELLTQVEGGSITVQLASMFTIWDSVALL